MKNDISKLLHESPLAKDEEEDSLITKFNDLTIHQTAAVPSKESVSSDHEPSCLCVDCTNPIRVILVMKYFHQLIETSYSDELLQCAKNVSNTTWTKPCNSLIEWENSITEKVTVKEKCSKQRSKGRKKKGSRPCNGGQSNATTSDFKTEVILPLKIKNASLCIHYLLTAEKWQEALLVSDQELGSLTPDILPFLHIPEVRLQLAHLHFIVGQARLQSADSTILKEIHEAVYPVVKTESKSSAQSVTSLQQDRARKIRHKRARKIIDSDEEEEEDESKESTCLKASLPKALVPFVSHFLSSYQLLSPTTLSVQLTKLLYNQLGVCLSTWHTNIAAHFLLHASYLSCSMNGVLWTWKKLRYRVNDVMLHVHVISLTHKILHKLFHRVCVCVCVVCVLCVCVCCVCLYVYCVFS